MEKSLAHGVYSSVVKQADPKHIEAFERILLSLPVATVITVLGADADLHLVGGAVRDVLDAKTETDLDLATIFLPEKVVALLRSAGVHVVETGLRHGTVTAVFENVHLEITTFRSSTLGAKSPFSSSIIEDLSGRDFTINAMAYSVNSRLLIDPFNGADDLRSDLIRAVGSAEARFEEDPLRMLRMIRFGPAQERVIEPQTVLAATKLAPLLEQVSVERVRSELEQILLSKKPAEALRCIKQCGFLPFCLPELIPTVGCEQNEFHHHDVFEHTLDVIQRSPAELILRLTALFHDIGKPQSLTIDQDGRRHFYKHELFSEEISKEAMQRLKFSNEQIRSVSTLVRYHMRPFDCGPAGVRRLLRDLGESFANWRIFKVADAPPKMEQDQFEKQKAAFDQLLDLELEKQRKKPYDKLALNGDDLIRLGLAPGVEMGQLLAKLHDAVIEDPELNQRDSLTSLAKEMIAKIKS